VSECFFAYDGLPTYSASIIEFENEHVVPGTQFSLIRLMPPPDMLALRAYPQDRTVSAAL